MKKSVLGVVAALLLLSAPVAAVSPGGIGGRPANPDPDNPRTGSIFIFNLDRGASKRDQIFVNNAGDETKTILIYPVDGIVSNLGDYTCKAKSEKLESMGAWIKLSASEVTLEPNTHALVDFTITVPANAEVGEKNACIAFQDKNEVAQTGPGVSIQTRQAVRVVNIVPGDIKRDIDIENFTFEKSLDDRLLPKVKFLAQANLKNTGNVSADVELKVSIKDMFGREIIRGGGGYSPVIADQKQQRNFAPDQISSFWGGWYTAQATISYDKRAGQFGSNDKSQLIYKESQTKTIFVWPSIPAVASVLAVIFFAAWFMMHRKTVKKNQGSRSGKLLWGAYVVKSGESLKTLAIRYKVTEEKLRSINHIGGNEDVQSGQKIFVPKGRAK